MRETNCHKKLVWRRKIIGNIDRESVAGLKTSRKLKEKLKKMLKLEDSLNLKSSKFKVDINFLPKTLTRSLKPNHKSISMWEKRKYVFQEIDFVSKHKGKEKNPQQISTKGHVVIYVFFFRSAIKLTKTNIFLCF